MNGTHYIVHTASPVPVMGSDQSEKAVVTPAVQGTLSILKAAKANKVKRVVITSSIAALCIHNDLDKMSFTPDDWSDLDACDMYCKSKTLAEKAAWDFQKDLKKDEEFEIVVICPGLVSGTIYVPGQHSSAHVYQSMMTGEWKRMPDMGLPVVDIRDTAIAHLNALKIEEAKNQRFILVDKCYKAVEIAQTFRKHFPQFKEEP